ncbi:acyltransferase family protein [Rheinheimera maricola]|uniref:Acyltransferase n=1 Tax=Rheinheimera maricola TaxID=2793282 RepID=A0ABS7XAV4_9GAMM|nr:acyltransferase [Rheinheimera maricola]MBZ9611747.1 acyltransferase [Rheinheimera maricola]
MYSWLKTKLEISHGENSPLHSMEGLRGIAVFLVFWVHYSSLISPWLTGSSITLANFIHSFGNIGVDLFFVLSGYLIYGSIINSKNFSTARYSKRRLQRIYPTFLVVFAIYLVLSYAFPNQSKLPADGIEKALYIGQNLLLLPGVFDITPIITVAWSLSYEVFYYIAIPIVVFSLRIKSWSFERRIWFWICSSAALLIGFTFFGGPIRMIMFIAGILLFEIYSKNQFTLAQGGTRFLVIALMLFGFRTVFEISYTLSMLSIYVLFLLLCLCAFNRQSFAYNWLTFTPLRWLGNMSYSYYLIHGLALNFCFLIFKSFTPSSYISNSLYYWLWIPLFLFTLVVSFFLFVFVERPMSLQVKR